MAFSRQRERRLTCFLLGSRGLAPTQKIHATAFRSEAMNHAHSTPPATNAPDRHYVVALGLLLLGLSLHASAAPGLMLASEPAIVAANSLSALDGTHDARLQTLPYADDGAPKHWIGGLRHLSLVTLWQNRRATLFVGVDRRGVAGLHLQRREQGEAELPALQLASSFAAR